MHLPDTFHTPNSHRKRLKPSPLAGSPRLLLASIILTAICIGTLIFLVLSPWSPFKRSVHGTPLKVGNSPYLYLCGVLDAETVARELGINSDKSSMNVREAFALQPDQKIGNAIDLLQLGSSPQSIDSSCTLKFDRQYSVGADGKKTASFINIMADAKQFKDGSAAWQDFTNTKKQTVNAKPLPNFADNGFYVAPVAAQQSNVRYALHTVLYRNVVLTYTVPLEENDTNGERSATQISKITTHLIKRLNKGEGRQITDYSAAIQYKGHPLIDSCAAVDYNEIQSALNRGVQFNALSFSANTALATDDDNGTVPAHVSSACRAFFRTAADVKAQAEAKPQPDSTQSTPLSPGESPSVRYPHAIVVQAITNENSATAKALIAAYKRQSEEHARTQPQGSIQITTDTIGDGSVHVASNPSKPVEAGSSTDIYYIAKDNYVFILTTSFTQQAKPYPISTQNVSPDTARLIFKVFEKAAHHAEKKGS